VRPLSPMRPAAKIRSNSGYPDVGECDRKIPWTGRVADTT